MLLWLSGWSLTLPHIGLRICPFLWCSSRMSVRDLKTWIVISSPKAQRMEGSLFAVQPSSSSGASCTAPAARSTCCSDRVENRSGNIEDKVATAETTCAGGRRSLGSEVINKHTLHAKVPACHDFSQLNSPVRWLSVGAGSGSTQRVHRAQEKLVKKLQLQRLNFVQNSEFWSPTFDKEFGKKIQQHAKQVVCQKMFLFDSLGY